MELKKEGSITGLVFELFILEINYNHTLLAQSRICLLSTCTNFILLGDTLIICIICTYRCRFFIFNSNSVVSLCENSLKFFEYWDNIGVPISHIVFT